MDSIISVGSPKRLSQEEMNKLIAEKVPLEERLRSVYLPITVMDCACYLAEDLLLLLSELRMVATKKYSRSIRSCVREYRNENRALMLSDLYKSLSETTKEFYNTVTFDMTVFQIQYQQSMLQKEVKSGIEGKMVALVCIIRDLVDYSLVLDRRFSNRISTLLGKGILYNTKDNKHSVEMLNILNSMLKTLGASCDLRTDQTDMAFRVLKNKLETSEIW